MTTSRSLWPATLALAILATPSPTQAPHSADAYEDLVNAGRMIENGHLGAAEATLKDVVLELPDSATAWYKLALTENLQGKKAAAAVSVVKALACKPDYTQARLLGAEATMHTDPILAKQYVREAVATAKDNEAVLRKAIEIMMELREFDDALGFLRKAIIANPQDQRLLRLMADIGLATESLETAASAFRRISSLSPDDPWPSESLARTLIVMGKYRDAIEAFRTSLTIHPSNTDARGKMVEVLEQIGADPQEIEIEKRYLDYYRALKKK